MASFKTITANRKSQPTGLAFSVGGASLFIARAPCARARDPVRIRHPKICKLACKAKGARIFTEGEIPGILFRKSQPIGMLFCFGGASLFIARAPCARARDPVRIRRRQCLPPYSRSINLMPMTLTRSQGFSVCGSLARRRVREYSPKGKFREFCFEKDTQRVSFSVGGASKYKPLKRYLRQKARFHQEFRAFFMLSKM